MQVEFKEVESDFKKIKGAFVPIFIGDESEEKLNKVKILVLDFIKKYTRPDNQVQLIGYYNAVFDKLGSKSVYGIISSVFETLAARRY